MKLFFLITIFIIITSSSYALFCIADHQSINISEDFTLTTVQDALSNLTLNKTYICRFKINFHYKRYIAIRFGKAFAPAFFYNNQKVRVDTWITIADGNKILNPAHITNSVEFACTYADECDRRFIRNHLEWLFKINYNQLESAVRLLLLSNNNNTGSCFDYKQNKEQSCADTICYSSYASWDNIIEGQCDKTNDTLTELSLITIITTDEDMYEAEEEENNEDTESKIKIAKHDLEIRYWCHANNCNNRTTVELMKKAVKNHYDLSAMYKILNVKTEYEPIFTTNGIEINTISAEEINMITISDTNTSIIITSTPTTTTTTENATSTSTLLYMSIILIIFNVPLLIFLF